MNKQIELVNQMNQVEAKEVAKMNSNVNGWFDRLPKPQELIDLEKRNSDRCWAFNQASCAMSAVVNETVYNDLMYGMKVLGAFRPQMGCTNGAELSFNEMSSITFEVEHGDFKWHTATCQWDELSPEQYFTLLDDAAEILEEWLDTDKLFKMYRPCFVQDGTKVSRVPYVTDLVYVLAEVTCQRWFGFSHHTEFSEAQHEYYKAEKERQDALRASWNPQLHEKNDRVEHIFNEIVDNHADDLKHISKGVLNNDILRRLYTMLNNEAKVHADKDETQLAEYAERQLKGLVLKYGPVKPSHVETKPVEKTSVSFNLTLRELSALAHDKDLPQGHHLPTSIHRKAEYAIKRYAKNAPRTYQPEQMTIRATVATVTGYKVRKEFVKTVVDRNTGYVRTYYEDKGIVPVAEYTTKPVTFNTVSVAIDTTTHTEPIEFTEDEYKTLRYYYLCE